MQTIETTDPNEARRARYAQYRNQKATLTLMGSTFTGMVRSVNEDRSGALKRWMITVVGMQGTKSVQPVCANLMVDAQMPSDAARWITPMGL
jgi:hypothetical protein